MQRTAGARARRRRSATTGSRSSRACVQCRDRCHHEGVQEIEIRGNMIRLGQLLKLSGLAGSGSEARALLLESGVSVNGEPELRRGRQLHRGDVVAVGDDAVRVA